MRLPPSEVWDLTPWQLSVLAESEAERADHDYRRDLSLAYHNAAFQRAKRLPPLKKILEPQPVAKGTDEKAIRSAFSKIIRKQNARKKVKHAENRQP